MAGFFPLFFKSYWSAGSAANSTFLLGIANSISSILLVVSAPFLGVLADRTLRRNQFLFFFTVLGALCSSGLFLVEQSGQYSALLLFALGSLGFFCGNIFYDSMLAEVCPSEEYDQTSGLGYAFGYLGGALLFSVQVFAFLKPEVFGLASGAEAIKWSFLSVGVWWLVFSLPLLTVKGANAEKGLPITRKLILDAFREVASTSVHIRQKPLIFWFLLSFLFYNDAVNTIIKMAVDYGIAIGFEPKDLIAALLITNFVGFPAAVAYGLIGERIGALKGLKIAIVAYIVVALFGSLMTTAKEFYVMAIVIGLFQGGIQALSRSHFTRIIPADKNTEYFGFFNLLGKFSAVFGPLLMGLVTYLTGSHRASISVIIAFLLLGWIFLRRHEKAVLPVKSSK